MSNRGVLTLVVVGGLLALVGSSDVMAQTRPECRAIYDQTTHNRPNPTLQREIKKLAGRNIDVHVQIFAARNDKGFDGPGEIAAYQGELYERCGLFTTDDDVVAIAVDLRSGEHHITDPAEHISKLRKNEFAKNLRNTESPYQEDAAHLLENPSMHQKIKYWWSDNWLEAVGCTLWLAMCLYIRRRRAQGGYGGAPGADGGGCGDGGGGGC